MAKLPRPVSLAGKRYDTEISALPRNAKNEFASKRLAAGQLLFDAGLGDFILALDNPAYDQATQEERREMLALSLDLAARILGCQVFRIDAPVAPVTPVAPMAAVVEPPAPPATTEKAEKATPTHSAPPTLNGFNAPDFGSMSPE